MKQFKILQLLSGVLLVMGCLLFVAKRHRKTLLFVNNAADTPVTTSPVVTEGVAGPCTAGVKLTMQENIAVLNCISNFKTFVHQRQNGTAREIERVNSHTYLSSDSRVLEIGGYTGEDAAKLIKKYDPYYMAMEPIPRFQKVLAERYKTNPKFTLLKFGLGKTDKKLQLDVSGDATSLFRKSNKASEKTKQNKKFQRQEAIIRNITSFFREIDVKRKQLDLITINCEGCEYELLELLISNQIVPYLRNIQFQFHLGLPGIANQECRYCQIQTLLSRTHKPTFQYAYTWQSWRRKTSVHV